MTPKAASPSGEQGWDAWGNNVRESAGVQRAMIELDPADV